MMRVGMARKNENSVAALRDKPNNMPPIMVAPEREVPGINASAWARPSLSASMGCSSSTSTMRGAPAAFARRSAHKMITPPSMKVVATTIGLNKFALMNLPNNKPKTASGVKAMAIFSAKFRDAWSLGRPPMTETMRARYSQQTARIAPD